MADMRDLCGFAPGQELTVKWVDEEGDPCIVHLRQSWMKRFDSMRCTRRPS